jgi:CMP-N,N'-diacetyllegionaminic acid synthase
MSTTGALALVLGRAGSKGVPGKNRAMIGGKPCVQWTIEAAARSTLVSKIALSTDDPEMLDLAERLGIIAIERPAPLASDVARVDDAARDALLALERRGTTLGPRDPILILYANVPIRPADLFDRAISMLTSTGCDSVQSYAPVGKYHPWWMARVDEHGNVRPWEGDVLNHGVFRRQELPPCHVPDGGVIALTRQALMLEIPGVPEGPHAFFGKDRRGVINPEGAVIDIDAPHDLIAAERALYARMK